MRVVHPFFELGEKVAINITDLDYYEVIKRWEELPDSFQAEFGWDGCWFQPDDPIPTKTIDMTWDEYVMLVQLIMLDESRYWHAMRDWV